MSATLIDARGVTRRHGDRTIFPALDVRIAFGDRLGLLGDNGAGKSTLLRILAGRDLPDGGTVERRGTLAYVPQLARASTDERTVRELAHDALGIGEATRALAAAEAELSTLTGDPERDTAIIERHAEALDRWVAADATTADADLDAAAERIGLPVALLDRPRSTLSSGQGARAGLLPVAARPIDAILLDEPTNHLDAAGRDLLFELLAAHRGAVVVASHDRQLLGEFAGRVVELSPRGEAPQFYGGGWDAFERERANASRLAEAAYASAIRRQAQLVDAEREMRRRAASSRSNVDRNAHDNDKHRKEWVRMRADGAQSRARKVAGQAERIEIPVKPWRDTPLALQLTAEEQRAPYVVALEAAVLRRGDWAVGPLDLAVGAGERVLLCGPNGSGKSTALRALAGTHPLSSGRRVQGTGAVVSVLGEVESALSSPEPVAAIVRALAGLTPTETRSRLAAVGLGPEIVERPATTLSPGERTRAELAVVGARRTTCLLLDEPSNHLDLRSLEALEAALDGWPGAVVLATHDRRLAARLRPTRTVDMEAPPARAHTSATGGAPPSRPAEPRLV